MSDAVAFTPEEQKKFDAGISELLGHYPADRKRAAMLPALRLLQELRGWCTPEGMKAVAEKLETTVERAYEVATFYVMFHTEKPGKYVIDVCTNLSCALRGAEYARATNFGDGAWDRRASADLGYDFVAVGGGVQHPVAYADLRDTEAILARLGVC